MHHTTSNSRHTDPITCVGITRVTHSTLTVTVADEAVLGTVTNHSASAIHWHPSLGTDTAVALLYARDAGGGTVRTDSLVVDHGQPSVLEAGVTGTR